MADIADVVACTFVILSNEKKRKRRREISAEGSRFSCNLLSTLKLEDIMGFRNFTRLTLSNIEGLLQLWFYGK